MFVYSIFLNSNVISNKDKNLEVYKLKTAVIYARYSSERQTEQSIEGQLHVCNDFAQRNDIKIVDTYIDRAMTGTNDNRAGFQRMLKDSYKKAWDYVLVYKLDRFSRNKYEMAMHKKTLKDNGIKLLSAMENIPDTPEGIILESLLEGMAEYYSVELSQKVRRGMNETRRKGNFSGGRILYGYKVENHKVIINEDEAQIVRKLFIDFASGRLITEILQDLRDTGILYRGKPFARSSIYGLIKNEKYSGKYNYNGEIFTNIYPQIISDELFETVRNKIENNKYGKHKPNIIYLFKNKLKCGYCGHPVNSDSGTSKNGTIMRYYKCSGRRIYKNCSLKPIRKELIEDLVVNAIIDTFATNDLIITIAKRIIEVRNKRLENDSVLNLLNNDISKINNKITNILTAIDSGIFTPSTKAHLEELEKQKGELEGKLLIEKTKVNLIITEDDIITHLKTALKKKPKQMIDMLVKEIKLYNDKIEIYFKYNNSSKETINENLQIYNKTEQITIHNQPKPKDIQIKGLI